MISTIVGYTGWWFGTFFIFPYVGNNNGLKPPTSIHIYIYIINNSPTIGYTTHYVLRYDGFLVPRMGLPSSYTSYDLGVPFGCTNACDEIARLDSNKTKENMWFTNGDITITIKKDDITTKHKNDININKGLSEKLK